MFSELLRSAFILNGVYVLVASGNTPSSSFFKILKSVSVGGAWLAQSEEHAALDLRVVRSSPTWGVQIT